MKHNDPNKPTMTERGIAHSADGKIDTVKGRLKDAVGGLTGDTGLQAEGKMDQLKGKVKDVAGKIERKLDERKMDEPG